MADVRINALSTTATSSASDDYLAIDGSANGTRKLSAYSPTFGGNLTVSGTGTNFFNGLNATASSPTTYTMRLGNGASEYFGWGFDGTYGYFQTWGGRPLYLNSQGNNIVTGSGNVLIGTTTDAGQKLQVAGTVAATTSAPINALVARYNSANSLFGITLNSSGQAVLAENCDASTYIDSYSKTGLPAFRLGNVAGSGTVPFWIDVAPSGTAGGAITWTNAFKIDASLNATFAGNLAIQSGNALRLNNPSNSGYASIYMDASNIINFNYTAAFGVTIRTQGGTASTPASASATGVAGTIQWDANYIYVCTAANTWKRAAIATW